MDGLAVTVLLRHDLPDGSSHYDWLLEQSGRAHGALMTFRVQERIDQPGVESFKGIRLPDHRWEYLTYQGEVSGDRGRVTRVARGSCRFEAISDERFRVAVTFEASQVWEGRREGAGETWVFRATPA